MTNYTWKIHSLTKRTINSIDSAIFTVVWEKFGISDDGYSGSVKTSSNFDINNIDVNSFIPYEELTEEILINWIKSSINEDSINNAIDVEIEKARSHWIQVESGQFPWDN